MTTMDERTAACLRTGLRWASVVKTVYERDGTMRAEDAEDAVAAAVLDLPAVAPEVAAEILELAYTVRTLLRLLDHCAERDDGLAWAEALGLLAAGR